MGPLATIPRGGCGWGKKPARRPDRYHKGKTIQLLAAFAPHTGKAIGLPSPIKTGEVMLAFLQDVVVPHFGNQRKVYLIWDNFSAHKLARRSFGECSRQCPVLLDPYKCLLAKSHRAVLSRIEENSAPQHRPEVHGRNRRESAARHRVPQQSPSSISMDQVALIIAILMNHTTS